MRLPRSTKTRAWLMSSSNCRKWSCLCSLSSLSQRPQRLLVHFSTWLLLSTQVSRAQSMCFMASWSVFLSISKSGVSKRRDLSSEWGLRPTSLICFSNRRSTRTLLRSSRISLTSSRRKRTSSFLLSPSLLSQRSTTPSRIWTSPKLHSLLSRPQRTPSTLCQLCSLRSTSCLVF